MDKGQLLWNIKTKKSSQMDCEKVNIPKERKFDEQKKNEWYESCPRPWKSWANKRMKRSKKGGL